MRTWDKANNIKKANLILETNYLWGDKLKTLSEDHIKYVLGIELPLNESYHQNPTLVQQIIKEQMLYEDFLKSVKDFAKDKIHMAVEKLKDWKETAAFIFKLITNPTLLENFTTNFWKTFKQSTLPQIKSLLTKFNLNGLFDIIQKVVDRITKLKGFKKFLAATAFGTIAKYLIEKASSFKDNGIVNFVQNYLSEKFIDDVIFKIVDFKSYLGFLEPIIQTTSILFKTLQPTIDKFRIPLNLNFTATT